MGKGACFVSLTRVLDPSMKLNKHVSSSRRKSRKRHFNAPAHIRRQIMSAPLSKELRLKYNVRSMPIHKGDDVQVCRGSKKESTSAKVIRVFRKKYVIHVERMTIRTNAGVVKPIGIHPSNVVIHKLKLNGERKALLERKLAGKMQGQDKEKYQEETTEA